MNIRKLNWPSWTGFLLSVIAFLSYFFVFVWFPVTRDFPWANLILFALAIVLLFVGFRRAFAASPTRQANIDSAVTDERRPKRSKIAASVLAILGIAVFGFFIFFTFIMAKWLPASQGAPRVGQKAPDFTLADTNGKAVSLKELLSSPINGSAHPKGVLLVFYRGYW